jgi:hypothetical protein
VPVESWLTDPFEISRHLNNGYFIIMAIISLSAIAYAWLTRFKWLSMYLWLIAGTIGLLWEASLFALGSRSYDFLSVAELVYHALTEAGPGLIIATITAHYVGIVDLERLHDPVPGDAAGGGPRTQGVA